MIDLKGKRGLVLGVANDRSIAYGCARHFRQAGAELALTYLNEKARPVTFYGSERVVEDYNLMGPVKAALESSVRYIAAELGDKGIRVHALSPGPMETRAASGIKRFDELMERARERAPANKLVTLDEVGSTAASLASDGARRITGNVIHVDAGMHIMG